MSEGQEVKMASEGTEKNQWGTGIFTRLDGKKVTVDSSKVTRISGVFFAIALCYSLFQGTENEVVIEGDVEIPKDLGQVVTFEVPAVKEDTAGSQKKSVSTKRRRGKQVIVYSAPSLVARPNSLKVPPGSMLEAKLVSGASNGLVRAETTKVFSFQGETMLEKGTILLGEGSSTEDRLFIHFNRLVLKDGAVQTVRAQAYDHEDETRGLKGSKIGSTALKLLASIGLNFAGGLSEGLQEKEVQGGAVVKKTTVKNALLNGASYAALDQSREMMSSIKNEQPIIEVEAGNKFYVIFEGK